MSDLKKDEKKSFIERVIDFLKGGDERKIARFHKKTVEVWKDNIDLANREITASEEKIEDLKEGLEEAALNINVESIKEVDLIPAYIESYTRKLNDIYLKIQNEENKITGNKATVKKYENFIALLKG